MILSEFVDGYITAALWSSIDDQGEPLDGQYSPEDIHPITKLYMEGLCQEFLAAKEEDLLLCQKALRPGLSLATYCGHKLWLDQNGHGTGFWDGDWPSPVGHALSGAAHALGRLDLYIGDDNMIHAYPPPPELTGDPLREVPADGD